jgi:hypothetical protein
VWFSHGNLHEAKTARQNHMMENGIEAQRQVFEVPQVHWSTIRREGGNRNLLTPKEIDILRIAEQVSAKIPLTNRARF